MALMLAICKPQPNWMPKNPKLMFQICQKLSRGFCMGGENQTVGLRRNTASIHHSRPVEASPFAGGNGGKAAARCCTCPNQTSPTCTVITTAWPKNGAWTGSAWPVKRLPPGMRGSHSGTHVGGSSWWCPNLDSMQPAKQFLSGHTRSPMEFAGWKEWQSFRYASLST